MRPSHWQGEGAGAMGRARLRWEGEESCCFSTGKGEFWEWLCKNKIHREKKTHMKMQLCRLGRGYGRFWWWQRCSGSFGTLELIIPRVRLLMGLVELVWLLSFLCVISPKPCRSTGRYLMASPSEAEQRSSARPSPTQIPEQLSNHGVLSLSCVLFGGLPGHANSELLARARTCSDTPPSPAGPLRTSALEMLNFPFTQTGLPLLWIMLAASSDSPAQFMVHIWWSPLQCNRAPLLWKDLPGGEGKRRGCNVTECAQGSLAKGLRVFILWEVE